MYELIIPLHIEIAIEALHLNIYSINECLVFF